MLNPLDTYLKPAFDAVRLREGTSLLVEIINEEDYIKYEVCVSGIKTAPEFAFICKNNEDVIHISSLYDLKDGVTLDDNFRELLTGPFTNLFISNNGKKVEISGEIRVEDYTLENVNKVFHYLDHNRNVIKKLHSISIDNDQENPPLKKECDIAMYKVYLYFRIYGSGLPKHIYRFFRQLTMNDIKSSLNTLLAIGLIGKDDDDYEIRQSEASNYIEEDDIVSIINQEIKSKLNN